MKLDDEETLYEKGCELAKQGRLEEAIECFDNALSINPMAIRILTLKGQALHDLERFEEAIPCCDKALEIDQNYAGAWLVKGISLHGLMKFKEAITCFDRILEISSDYAKEAYYNKGNALKELRRLDEAISYYDQALEIDQKIPEFWQNKGVALEELVKFKEAVSCYDHALELDPKNPEIWNNKGNSLTKLGALEESLKCYETALEINPNHILSLNNKSIALNSSGKFHEAIACCDHTLKINPKDAMSWHFKGYALHGLRRFEEAEKCLHRVIELDPESELASEASKLIDEIDDGIPVSDMNKKSEDYANILNLCESDPDAGLEFIEQTLKEKPETASDPFGKFAKAIAYGSKGLFTLARSKPEIDFILFDENEMREELGITDLHLDYLEKGLRVIREMEEIHPGALKMFGTEEDRLGESKVDAMAMVLERCRPGRVQEILGKTKLKYFGPNIRVSPHENCKITKEELVVFAEIFFTCKKIAKSAIFSVDGKDNKGRRFVVVTLFEKHKVFDVYGERSPHVGSVTLFDDGTFYSDIPKELWSIVERKLNG